MASWFAKELLFFLSLASMTQVEPPVPQFTRSQGIDDTEYKVLWHEQITSEQTTSEHIASEQTTSEQITSEQWRRFDDERLSLSGWSVPHLTIRQYNDLAGWSCGPDAITRAVALVTGKKPFNSGIQYTRFALGLPKGLGVYHDHQYDHVMPFNSYGLTVAYYPLWMLNIPQKLQGFLSGLKLKTGAPPQWLAQYMTAYAKAGNGMSGLEFDYFGTDDFDALWQQVVLHLDKRHGVIPLVATGALQWHYLNIVGYNPDDRQVLMQDYDRLKKWSIARLQALMYMGFNDQYYQPAEYAAYAVGGLVNWLSTVNYYNVIFVRPKGDRTGHPEIVHFND
ncbi:hypothetical protein GZ77_09905 [Endozoicomonas montiporae]|uniref:Uncharacterized protein n=2 Tax=Endozoicomonas montiporae TaxID=1027273 RepID=A0A081N851_9GAMM|nr:hypothetical protein [Endozoicomonas montiporae]AMO55490.1 hypothetical protein EZMO1_1299 [Endozoicomonas montiporae CL-33]KEQ14624.1 hypothetical protein GZ77_09905 [Endozoicomonas montiporae]